MKVFSFRLLCLAATMATGAFFITTSYAQMTVAKVDAVAALVPPAIKDAGVLRIAVPDIGKPLAYKEGGSLKGMDVELANAVAQTMGLKAEISLIPFSAALTGLQANKFDISYGEFYVTAERLKTADFVSNWQDYSTYLVKKSSGFSPKTLADICGHKMGAMAGSAELATLKTASDKCGSNAAAISAFPSINNAVLALNSGRVDGVLINRGGAQESIRLDQGLDASGAIGGGPTATAVARNDNSAQLLEALKGAYEHLITSGDYAKILTNNDTAYGAVKTIEVYKEGSTPPTYSF